MRLAPGVSLGVPWATASGRKRRRSATVSTVSVILAVVVNHDCRLFERLAGSL